ncbi:MAG: T9SS type A sorting domain-containing protein [Cytophagales bacterium]|nr:T9SS type A sorting domain-containing protein [Cytophagales bacterium]
MRRFQKKLRERILDGMWRYGVCLMLGCLVHLSLKGQEGNLPTQVLASAGHHHQTDGAQLSWTLGEVFYLKYVSGDGVLSRGFQQGDDLMMLFLGMDMEPMAFPEEFTLEETVRYFPNPAKDFLNIEVPEVRAAYIELYDMGGILLGIWNFDMEKKMSQIDVSPFEEGVYQIQIKDVNHDPLYKFRFIKR